MSGRKFFKANADKILKSVDRRSFLLKAGLLTTGIALNACIKKIKRSSSYSHIKGQLKGPDMRAGHILRDKIPVPPPSGKRAVGTLIIGGGISGLSAARWLKRNGYENFELIELELNQGGNSRFGGNQISSFPLGAHYITIPNNHDKELLQFLEEGGIITGYNDGLPVYDEFSLCFDPEERLLINGQWQEGLVPDFGLSEKDKQEIKSFFKLTEQLKKDIGDDGKYAFDIPLDNSSTDPVYRKLDNISFKDYLSQEGFTSPYLLWYLEYCCKDDYGQKLNRISAWAGLHYFAARKGKADNAENNTVLTWPEGNGKLMQLLSAPVKTHILTSKMACNIALKNDKVEILLLDLKSNKSEIVTADNVLLATPQFVNAKILDQIKRPAFNQHGFNYAPWLIANISVQYLSQGKGAALSWDNVAFNTPSVGYVNANQQSTKLGENKKVITYYLPLCDHNCRVSRLAAYARTYEQWLDIIMPELEFMHPGIEEAIENIDLWVWGHGMISPTPGFIWGNDRKNASRSIENKIFFAHSDLSGISIFEEAFHQGIKAANEILDK